MKVLVIGNDRNYVGFLGKKLSAVSVESHECTALDLAIELAKRTTFDALICCLPLLNKSCPFEVVTALEKSGVSGDIILISDNIQLHTAMSLMRVGVFSCFNRPFPLEQLTTTLQKIKQKAENSKSSPALSKRDQQQVSRPEKSYVRGSSRVAQHLYKQIDLVGPTSFSVIIYGETGTGKEAVAHRVASAKDAEAPYIAVDCGCLSKELALSELFGHEKGSFTGAVAKKIGAFELAHNGTLFLDEIGNLDYEVQGFLLRAIQERKIKRVGGTTDIAIQTRIVVASNEPLADAVKAGKFREDLFHRLNEFQITVPPLRTRPEDLSLFIEKFLADTNAELSKNVQMPDALAIASLQRYSWPGNIRELKNIIRRACLFCPNETAITTAHLPSEIVHYKENDFANPEVVKKMPFGAVNKKPRAITAADIEEALKIAKYNKTRAAVFLGIDRKTLYNKLRSEAAWQPQAVYQSTGS